MPGVEFLGDNIGERFNFTYSETGRLWLPARSQRAVRLEVIMNLSPSEAFPSISLLDFRGMFPHMFSRSGIARPDSLAPCSNPTT